MCLNNNNKIRFVWCCCFSFHSIAVINEPPPHIHTLIKPVHVMSPYFPSGNNKERIFIITYIHKKCVGFFSILPLLFLPLNRNWWQNYQWLNKFYWWLSISLYFHASYYIFALVVVERMSMHDVYIIIYIHSLTYYIPSGTATGDVYGACVVHFVVSCICCWYINSFGSIS